MSIECQRCGAPVASFSPMRKWCVECRRLVSLEQARTRRNGGRSRIQVPKQPIKATLKLNKI